MLIDPSEKMLPCHAASVIPGLQFENVRTKSVEWIWEYSDSVQRFRDESWMPEPCRSCDRRTRDFGGCRCQAFLLAGDAAATDPVCTLAPTHAAVEEILQRVNGGAERNWVYRIDPS